MASLKNNYKDDMFSGNRKYTMITNPDGTVSFTDTTVYTQVGDTLGALDMNAITSAVNLVGVVKTSTIAAAGWSGTSAPYTNTVNIPGITNLNTLYVSIASGVTPAQYAAAVDAQLHCSAQGTDSITMKAFDTKPTVDIPITVLLLS